MAEEIRKGFVFIKRTATAGKCFGCGGLVNTAIWYPTGVVTFMCSDCLKLLKTINEEIEDVEW